MNFIVNAAHVCQYRVVKCTWFIDVICTNFPIRREEEKVKKIMIMCPTINNLHTFLSWLNTNILDTSHARPDLQWWTVPGIERALLIYFMYINNTNSTDY